MTPDILIPVREKTDVATARREALELANFQSCDASDLGIVVTEAATNLIKHAGGGEIVLRKVHRGMELLALDRGPGIPDVERSFGDGYSTAGSQGTGLGAIRRIASFCDIYSAPQKGTALVAGLAGVLRAPDHVGAVAVSFPGERVSGDAWRFEKNPLGFPVGFRLALADGLGHGALAAEASDAALEMAMARPDQSLLMTLDRAHARLRPTRGAALSLIHADLEARSLRYAGVGNVAAAIVDGSGGRRPLVNHNGTLGHELRKPRQYTYEIGPDALVVMHSDGLSGHWSLDDYPGLFQKHPTLIAGVLFRDFRRTRDDITVVVARSGGREE